MKLIFAGTPEFAAIALAQLLAAGHEVALVLSQPDRPGGRGMKLQASPVKQLALSHGLAVAQPRSLRLDGKYPQDAAQARQALEAAQADAMVVAAYGLILPQWVLDACSASVPGSDSGRPGMQKLGCFNIHASLLPRWRGAAPIHRAIEAGDASTGITIMQMDAGLDTGDMLLTQALLIGPAETTGSLHDRLAPLGGQLMVQALALAAQGRLHPVHQPLEGITYASKVDKAEAAVDWSQTAQIITRRVRAFNPFPGASTVLNGETLKIWAAEVSDALPAGNQRYGEIVAVAHMFIAVAAMNSIVNVTELQRPGGKRMAVADFLRGSHLQAGQVLG